MCLFCFCMRQAAVLDFQFFLGNLAGVGSENMFMGPTGFRFSGSRPALVDAKICGEREGDGGCQN